MDQLLYKKIQRLLIVFIIGLIVSGLTALPIEWQLKKALDLFVNWNLNNSFTDWIAHIHAGVESMNSQYPFLAYGTDWLAFAHFMIAIVFIGAVRDPIRNIWVIEFGLIACVSIFPFSFIAGAIREIPIYWRLIDCSFGLFGGLILWRCYRLTKQLVVLQMK